MNSNPINRLVTINTTEPIVSLDHVLIKFADFVAVKDLTMHIKPGEIVGILGSNGAGKSSTMRSIAGIIKPSGGSIVIDGLDLASGVAAEQAKGLTGYCPDVGGLIVGATPREHIQLLLNLHKKPQLFSLGLQLIEDLGLLEFIDTPVGGFSHGMSRRLSVLLAALSAEKVLILDEPFDGVDPIGVEGINKVIFEAKASGLAVIISTHLQELLTHASDRIVIMRKGEILHESPSENFYGQEGAKKYQTLLESE